MSIKPGPNLLLNQLEKKINDNVSRQKANLNTLA